MEEYLLNTTINTLQYHMTDSPVQFIFKIYKNGNVIVTMQYQHRSGHGPVSNQLEINDNIPLPEYVISILKILLQTTYVPQLVSEHEKCVQYYNTIVLNVIKMFKEQKCVETKQIDFYMKQTEEVENKLTEKNIYIESLEINIQKLNYIKKELYKQTEELENKLTEKDIYIESLENKYTESHKVIEELKTQNTMIRHNIDNLETKLNELTELNKDLDSKNIILTDKNNTLKESINYCSKKCWCYHNIDCNFK